MAENENNETSVDQIWLTPDASIPFWAAMFILITLVGVFLFWPIAVGAGIVVFALLVKWAKTGAKETAQLPRG